MRWLTITSVQMAWQLALLIGVVFVAFRRFRNILSGTQKNAVASLHGTNALSSPSTTQKN